MSSPGYGIIITYKNGRVEKKIVANNPHTRNAVKKLWEQKAEVKSVGKYTEKNYF